MWKDFLYDHNTYARCYRYVCYFLNWILKGMTIYDQRVLSTFTSLRKESPSLSIRAFIATLQAISEEDGKVRIRQKCFK